MKKDTKKEEFLEQIRKIPIIQVAAEKTGLSRNTIYRWRKEDSDFQKALTEAVREGEELVNDMSESQLLTMIKEKNWPAISFWLRHHHAAYRNRLEVTTVTPNEELTPEQEILVREALRLSATFVESENNKLDTSHEYNQQDASTTGSGSNDEKLENANSDK